MNEPSAPIKRCATGRANFRLVMILLAILTLPLLLFGTWWATRVVRITWFERDAVHLLAQAEAREDEVRQLWFHQWADGSWILTRFSEECCGDAFDAHVLRTSDAGIFIAEGAHYCGVEGLAERCRRSTSAQDFRRQLSDHKARLVPVRP